MQEIKFRGRRTYDKEWVYGNLVIDKQGYKHIVPTEYFEEDGHHLCYNDDTDKPIFFDQETIGQFIGQKDFYGLEIYDGDILQTNEADWIAQVIYHYDGFMLTGLDHTGFSYSPDYDKCKIITNKHDHPELITNDN